MQAAIRYAYMVDVALRDGLPTQENRAEGWGFWRMVAPFIAEQDPAGAATVTAIFDLSKTVAVRLPLPLYRHALMPLIQPDLWRLADREPPRLFTAQAASNNDHYYFCTAKAVIMNALPSGVTSGDIGLLEGTGSIACGGVNRSPPAGGAAFAPPPAGADDCTCSCCDAASCPAYTHGMFYAGAATGCTATACSAHFYFCPDAGAHTTGSRVTAKYGNGLLDTRLVGSQVRREPKPSRKLLLTLIPSIALVLLAHTTTTSWRAGGLHDENPSWLACGLAERP